MKEIRVYLVNAFAIVGDDTAITDLSDSLFMEIAEKNETVYTLKEFEKEFNADSFGAFSSGNDYIRFIEVDV